MAVRTLFAADVSVAYAQAYVESSDDVPSYEYARGGQVNGLCGAAVPGLLFLTTGTHTGRVPFVVEAHDAEPVIDDGWEEVVEASFRPATPHVRLVGWGGGSPGPGAGDLGIDVGDWRVRYCASGMDEGRAADVPDEEEGPLDRYLLQFWPAPPAPDRVVRVTSEAAAYWHASAREAPPPPPPPTPEEIAEAARGEERARSEARERFEVRAYWGGRAPSARLRGLGGNVRGLARSDRDLLDALDRAGPALQRAIARWAARRACEVAGLASQDWVAPALDALDQGEPLPPPFDAVTHAFDRLSAGDPPGTTYIAITTLADDDADADAEADVDVEVDADVDADAPRPRISRPHAAIPAVTAAAEADPLRAAVDAVTAAAAAHDEDARLFAAVREAFPTLR